MSPTSPTKSNQSPTRCHQCSGPTTPIGGTTTTTTPNPQPSPTKTTLGRTQNWVLDLLVFLAGLEPLSCTVHVYANDARGRREAGGP